MLIMLTAACVLVLAFRPLADADDPRNTASVPDATRTPTAMPNRLRLLLITSFSLAFELQDKSLESRR
jgi:hypothetical protein